MDAWQYHSAVATHMLDLADAAEEAWHDAYRWHVRLDASIACVIWIAYARFSNARLLFREKHDAGAVL